MTSILIPVFLYSLVMTGTPGPNNMMLTASGARFGYRRTLPLLLGIVLGVCSMLALSALGLGVLFDRFPVLQSGLKIAGSLYLAYLAWKVAFSGAAHGAEAPREKPLGFWHGAAFQYLNPKAYVMTVTAMSVYSLAGEEYVGSALLIIAVFAVVAPAAISLWAAFGTVLGRLMAKSGRSRAVNYGLGVLTAASVAFIWI